MVMVYGILTYIALATQVVFACIPMTNPPPSSTSTSMQMPTEAPTTPEKVTTGKPVNKECVTVELNPGRPCVFPFNYQYKDHYECLPFEDKYWCGLTSLYDKQQWGYCDQSLCPPTKVLPTEMSNTTTEAMPSLEWEEGSTTAEIMYSGTSQSCEIRFKLALEKGVQLREISSVCRASSSPNSEDMIEKLGIHSFSLTTLSGIELACEVGAVFLEDSKTLSEEVLKGSLKCEAVEAECVTMDGEVYPAQCVFPFNYQGRRYQACTDRPGSSKLWCPTQVGESEEAMEQYWGYCSQMCGYCAGSPLNTRDGEGKKESCGYDCLLRADKKMVGFDRAPLSRPTITVMQPKEENYIGVVASQHQLYIGPQSVSISCPETKFYDPALFGENSVLVECYDKYRLKVTTESGFILGFDFQNDQFGCDPCPESMSYVEGYLYYTDFESMGTYNKNSIGQCHTLCMDSLGCRSFQFSKEKGRCQLMKNLVQKPSSKSRYKDHIVCTKSAITCEFKRGGCIPLTGLAFEDTNRMVFQIMQSYADQNFPKSGSGAQKAYFMVVDKDKMSEMIGNLEMLRKKKEVSQENQYELNIILNEKIDDALLLTHYYGNIIELTEEQERAKLEVEEAAAAVKIATELANDLKEVYLKATQNFKKELLQKLQSGSGALVVGPEGEKIHTEVQLLHKMISQANVNSNAKMMFLYSTYSPCSRQNGCLQAIMENAEALLTGSIKQIIVQGTLTGNVVGEVSLQAGHIQLEISGNLVIENVKTDVKDGTIRTVKGTKLSGHFRYSQGGVRFDMDNVDLTGFSYIPGIGSETKTLNNVKFVGGATITKVDKRKVTIELREPTINNVKIGDTTQHKWVVGFDSWYTERGLVLCEEAKKKWCKKIKDTRRNLPNLSVNQLKFLWFNEQTCPWLKAETANGMFNDC